MENRLNTYRWLKFKVTKRTQIPFAPHYQAMVFTIRSEWTPGYDRDDSGSSSTVPHIETYVFEARADLDSFVSDAATTNTDFVFFHVSAPGKATVKVDVATNLDTNTVVPDSNPMHRMGYGRGDK